jgi:DNA mismatch endonuclease (patch repair protein)
MVDIWSKAKRSEVMSHISSTDTKPELIVRSALHRAGFRFSLHRKDLPGRPDIVLPKHKAIVLVNGCFWHRHSGCRLATMPSSSQTYWKAKFEKTILRDRRNVKALSAVGWKVLLIWECQVKDAKKLTGIIQKFLGKNKSANIVKVD